MSEPDIIYTKVDEAPELASGSFLPIIQSLTQAAGIQVGTKDISLAGRIIAQFSDQLPKEQQQPDDLSLLGEMVLEPEANVIKLPNISASLPQIKAAVTELQSKGYKIPDYPENPQNDAEKAVQAKYDKVKGSAVNPVLRQGNSDRRAAVSVKNYAKSNPHKMGKWSKDSKTSVAHMESGDFYSNEKSAVITEQSAGNGRIEFVGAGGKTTVLKEKDGWVQRCPECLTLSHEVVEDGSVAKQHSCGNPRPIVHRVACLYGEGDCNKSFDESCYLRPVAEQHVGDFRQGPRCLLKSPTRGHAGPRRAIGYT